MIVMAAVIVAVVVVFGTSAARLALQDLAALETEQAAQRAAEAAAGRAAGLIVAGASGTEIDSVARSEATAVAGANVARGTIGSVTATRSSSAADLVIVHVTVMTSYAGFAGPFEHSAAGVAAVPRP